MSRLGESNSKQVPDYEGKVDPGIKIEDQKEVKPKKATDIPTETIIKIEDKPKKYAKSKNTKRIKEEKSKRKIINKKQVYEDHIKNRRETIWQIGRNKPTQLNGPYKII